MESSTPEVSIDVQQQQKICALLDFVMECNRNHRLTSRMLEPENSYVSLMEDAVLDSALIVDSHAVLSPSQDETANVPKEHVVDSVPKFRPPRKGVSAVRSFPPGCGRGAPPVRIQHGSKCLLNDGSRSKNKHWHGESTKNAKKLSAATFSGAGSSKFKLQSPIIRRTEFEDRKLLEDTMRKTTGNKDGSIQGNFSREFDSVKSDQERLAPGREPMVKRIVVQALTAAPNCPWRQGKRMWKSKPTKRTREGKGL